MKTISLNRIAVLLIVPGVIALAGCHGEHHHGPGHGHDHPLDQEGSGEHPHGTPEGEVFEDNLEITDEILAEIDSRLDMLAYGLIDLSGDAEFIDILESNVARQFDGDDNVLFKDLSTACADAGLDLEGAMRVSILAHAPEEIQNDIHHLGEALEAMKYDGIGFYPQVYIPFRDEVPSSASPAAIVPLASDVYDVAESAPGYRPTIDSAGQVVGFAPTVVDEATASSSPVWVVSINERVNYKGELGLVYQKTKRRADCPPTKWFEFYPTMTIHDGKESWFSGKSEIYFGFSQYDPFYPHDVTRWTDESYIKKIKRKDIGDQFSIHQEFTNDWSWCDGKMALIIYERDKPAKKKTFTYENNRAMEFQSKQSAYWSGYFFESDYFATGPWQGVETSHGNSGQIDFSMRGREN